MKQYLNADLHRIAGKSRFLIAMLLEFAAAALFAWTKLNSETFRTQKYVKNLSPYICYLPLVLGTVLFIAVICVDFRAGTMREAVARGVSRISCVLAKFIEIVIFTLISETFIALILIFMPALYGKIPDASGAGSILMSLLMAAVRILSCSAVSLAFAVGCSGKAGPGIYIFLSSGLLHQFFTYIRGMKPVQKILGTGNAPTLIRLTSDFISEEGHFGVQLARAAGMAAYVAVPLLISLLMIRRREFH